MIRRGFYMGKPSIAPGQDGKSHTTAIQAATKLKPVGKKNPGEIPAKGSFPK
jgi:hypothetical protein